LIDEINKFDPSKITAEARRQYHEPISD